jgi:dUTP pyrophosphatase
MQDLEFELVIHDERLKEERYKVGFDSTQNAGLDLRACIDERVIIYAGETALIPTGFAYQSGDTGLVGLIMPRSGKGHKEGLVIGNLTGVIDKDYQGQVFISAWNRNRNKSVTIEPMERIAQMLFAPVVHPKFTVVDGFTEDSERGAGGFGSTGKE